MYPGSFNPPTVAHLAIAAAAVDQCGLATLELVISHDPLGKDGDDLLPRERRLAVLERAAASRPWLRFGTTENRLIADIAAGFDVIVLGADKWAQVTDPAWYGASLDERDRALARLPRVAVAPRTGFAVPDPEDHPELDLTVLDLHEDHRHVSATAVRAGRTDWLLPEATGIAGEVL